VARATDGVAFVAAGEKAVADASVALARAGLGIRALVPHTASLEELFFRLTEEGEGERDGAVAAAERRAA
jgi:ABC-2 type transport system ATP-binding protein